MNCPKCKENHEYRSEAVKCLILNQRQIDKIAITGKGKQNRERLKEIKNKMYTYTSDFELKWRKNHENYRA